MPFDHKAYYLENRERILARQAAYRANHRSEIAVKQREYAKSHPETQRRWHKDHPEYMEGWRRENTERLRHQRLERTAQSYDIPVEQVYATKGALCDLCGEPEKVGRLTRLGIDHDHRTGRVRGHLCVSCNISLGKYERGAKRTKFHRLGLVEKVNAYLRWL